MIELSPDQRAALTAIEAWRASGTRRPFVLAGAAGAGKTTILRELGPGLTFAAPTGKAANVLASKLGDSLGFDRRVTTVHSLLYQPREVTPEQLEKAANQVETLTALAAQDPRAFGEQLEMATRTQRALRRKLEKGGVDFLPKSGMAQSFGAVVVDEASMVSERMQFDLQIACERVLYVGDGGQLPPIEGAGFFERNKPDARLETIHRQAAGNPILRLAHAIRNGGGFDGWDQDERLTRLRGRQPIDRLLEADMVLCGLNETRRRICAAARRKLGRRGLLPRKGEPIVCLRNDWKRGIMNGELGVALEDASGDRENAWGTFLFGGAEVGPVRLDTFAFRQHAEPGLKRETPAEKSALQVDFAYALTVHKAQGSEARHVYVVDDGFGKDDREFRRRWLYTAVTRASERLTFASPV